MSLAYQTGLDVRVNRRGFLRAAACGFAGASGFAALPAFADQLRKEGRACILLWMAGGPSQFETLDPKPGAETQGPTRAIPTAAPGISIAEHWTNVAKVTRDLAII